MERPNLGRRFALTAAMKTFRTLELAIQFNDKAEAIKLKGHLKDQLLRAASSITLNLAEGNAKPSEKEKKRFYQTAYASVKECQVVFRLAHSNDPEIEALADHLGASIYKLLQSKIPKMPVRL
jgi:four helix bundle protein